MNLRKQPPAGDPDGQPASSWAEYVQRHLDALGWNNATLARVAQLPDGRKLDRSLIGRWINEGTQPSIDSIRAVARALNRDIREGLVAAGMLTAEEVGLAEDKRRASSPDLRLLSDEELLDEVRRRMKRHQVAAVPDTERGEAYWSEIEEQDGYDVGETEEVGGRPSEIDAEPAPESGGDGGQEPQAQQGIGAGS